MPRLTFGFILSRPVFHLFFVFFWLLPATYVKEPHFYQLDIGNSFKGEIKEACAAILVSVQPTSSGYLHDQSC